MSHNKGSTKPNLHPSSRSLPYTELSHTMAIVTEAYLSAPTTIEDLHPDLLTDALRRLDGRALAAATCATSRLRSLSTHPDLWSHLCLTTFPSLRLLPSLPISHSSFFSLAHPFPSPAAIATVSDDTQLPATLISAVDIHHRGVPILSRVISTDSSTDWFRGSPFRVDALDRKDPAAPPPSETPISPEELTLNWVIIDTETPRAINVSSRRLVAVDRHWYTGETLLRYATVVGEGTEKECAVVAVVACGEAGQVREVSLTAEDMEGMCLCGRESLGVIKGLMEGCRTAKEGEAEAARRYADHVGRRRERKERKMRREGLLDLCCSGAGVILFLSFLLLVAFR